MAGELFAVPIILFFMISMFAIAILAFAFWIWMLVDCAQRKFKTENDKIVWILIVVLTGIVGALIYYSVVKYKDRR